MNSGEFSRISKGFSVTTIGNPTMHTPVSTPCAMLIPFRELERAIEQDNQEWARNLLERLKRFEEDVLRFMNNEIVPFTNNQGERETFA